MIICRTLITFVFVVTLSGLAQAASLFTPPLEVRDTEDFRCYIVNVSSKVRTVSIQIFQDTNLEADSGEVDLQPGETLKELLASSAAFAPLYCKFTVNNKKSTVRASSCIYATEQIRCIGAVSAE